MGARSDVSYATAAREARTESLMTSRHFRQRHPESFDSAPAINAGAASNPIP